MGKKQVVACLILVCCGIFIGGCWDRRELQERNFVLAVGIDMADVQQSGVLPLAQAEKNRTETFVQPHGSKRYRLSLQLLKLGGGEKSQSKTYVISNTGESLFEMVRDMLGQSSKSLWFEHIQVIVISEAVLRQSGLGEVLDFFQRDSEMRARIKLYVTSGEAISLLEYTPPSKEPGGVYLAELSRLQSRNAHVPGPRNDIGFMTQFLDGEIDIILPRIERAGSVVKLSGAAVFKKDNFIGYADEYAIAGRRFVNGSEKSAIITVLCPNHRDHEVVFELYRHDTKLKPHIDGEAIYYTLDITMYGNIGEVQGDIVSDDTMNFQYISKVEQAVAEEVKCNVLYAEKIFRKEMKVDSVGVFSSKLKAYEPDRWAQVKEQWNEIYPVIPLVISVNVSILANGNHK